MGKKPSLDFDARIIVRMPRQIARIIEQTAFGQMDTISGYIRKSVIEKLERDGIKAIHRLAE